MTAHRTAPKRRPTLVLVTPALADAANGNWQTAQRWRRLLAGHCDLRLVRDWSAGAAPETALAMIALHARRSAPSVAAWAAAHPERGLAVVLTGTDLYRDIQTDAAAQRSLQLAHQLVTLQDMGPRSLPEALRPKTRVIVQSTTPRQTLAKPKQPLRAVMVGHLRMEKSPQTLFDAVRRLQPADGVRIDHIGAALDPALGAQAQALMAACPHYRWLGALPHEAVRRRIQRAHLLVHPSLMEGGAHVVMEAVCSGTPVLASRVDGNVGMLGDGYAGYFAPGDAAALADTLARCAQALRAPDVEASLLQQLQVQCGLRAPLFSPLREQADLLRLCTELVAA